MDKYKKKEELNNNDIIGDLIRLPKRNLEAKIRQLETDIRTRQKINDKSLTSLSTHQLQLKDRLWQQRYISDITGLTIRNQISSKIIQLEEDIQREIIGCFGDISELKEKLQEASEEFENEKVKLKLLDSQN